MTSVFADHRPSALKQIWAAARVTALRNIQDLRYSITLALVLATVVLCSFLAANESDQRAERARQFENEAWRRANLEYVQVVRRPSPWGFFCNAGEDQLPAYMIVTPGFVDSPLENLSSRPVVRPFARLDWVFLVGYFYSLMAIVLTFDSISGERESGTLCLVFAQPVTRLAWLAGRLLGTVITLLACLLAGLPLYSLMGVAYGLIPLDVASLTRIGLLFLQSALLILVMCLFGVLASSLTSRSSTALTVVFLIWVFQAVFVPIGAELAGRFLVRTPSFLDFQNQVASARVQYLDQMASFSSLDIDRITNRPGFSLEEKRLAVKAFEASLNESNYQAIATYKKRLREIRSDYLLRQSQRRKFVRYLNRLSPIELFRQSLEASLGVGHAQFVGFEAAVNEYMHTYTQFAEGQRRELENQARRSGVGIEENGFLVFSVNWVDYEKVEFARPSMPAFQAVDDRVWARLEDAIEPSAWLLLLVAAQFCILAWRILRLEFR